MKKIMLADSFPSPVPQSLEIGDQFEEQDLRGNSKMIVILDKKYDSNNYLIITTGGVK